MNRLRGFAASVPARTTARTVWSIRAEACSNPAPQRECGAQAPRRGAGLQPSGAFARRHPFAEPGFTPGEACSNPAPQRECGVQAPRRGAAFR
jgi:hypothetical protein